MPTRRSSRVDGQVRLAAAVKHCLQKCVGAAYIECMQYTIRSIPRDLDDALRRRALAEGRSLNALVTDALRAAEDLGEQPHRDLSWLAGTWDAEGEVDSSLADQRSIDPELWSP